MPLLENKGAKIYWDEQGAGDPILLIMGLGFTAHMWERMRPDLSRVHSPMRYPKVGSC